MTNKVDNLLQWVKPFKKSDGKWYVKDGTLPFLIIGLRDFVTGAYVEGAENILDFSPGIDFRPLSLDLMFVGVPFIDRVNVYLNTNFDASAGRVNDSCLNVADALDCYVLVIKNFNAVQK